MGIYVSISKMGPFYSAMFLSYFVFVQVSVLNIISSQFVESAMRMAKSDHQENAREEKRVRHLREQHFRELCTVIDVDHSTTIRKDEFVAHITSARFMDHWAVLGMDSKDEELVFDLLAL